MTKPRDRTAAEIDELGRLVRTVKGLERLERGCCPTHGITLIQTDVAWENQRPVGYEVGCPRRDCSFKKFIIRPGSRLWRILVEDGKP